MQPMQQRNQSLHNLTRDFQNLYQDASAYLSPFFLEFTLTSSAMLATMWIERRQPIPRVVAAAGQRSLKSPKPLALGFFVGPVTVVLLVLLLHYVEHGDHPEYMLYGYNILMALIMIVCCVVGCVVLRQNDKIRERTNTEMDEVLLFIGAIGIFLLEIFELHAAWSCFRVKCGGDFAQEAKLKMTESFLWIFQTVVQVFFIVSAFHRKPRNVSQLRGIAQVAYLAVFLGMLNLGMWLLNTIQAKRSVYSHLVYRRLIELEQTFLGDQAWAVITVILYPLRIFLRIHSVATFYHVFKKHNRIPTNENNGDNV
ncbi:proton channel OtopLc-like [Oscarella lobularis]|uniref:proton channel OtopLc-like n=1 Tax=Oscarella lobularis TaxID=121494 RepID=UPI0033137B69